jgi:hypothetical protein
METWPTRKRDRELEETVAAFREALKEQPRERAPIGWTTSIGHQGVVLALLADRRRDIAMAETAVKQISEAFRVMRDTTYSLDAPYFERQLAKARDSLARLRRQQRKWGE